MSRNCQHCEEKLPRNSRASKIYCSDNCRKAANALKNKEARKETNKKYYEKSKDEKAGQP